MTPQARGSADGPGSVSLACVVLTMGNRPDELARALRSVAELDGDPVDLVVVGNGTTVDRALLPPNARAIDLPENLGAPGGRNAALDSITADVVLFLDDDGWYDDPATGDRVRALFDAQPRLGIVSMRITNPDGLPTEQRHVPRLGRTDPSVSSEVTTFLEGACAIRRVVFDEVGGFPAQFFFGHEASDFAWRALDAGWRIRYEASVHMCHPPAPANRHPDRYRTDARNRAWLVRRNLPLPLAVLHLMTWAALTAARTRFSGEFRSWLRGLREGLRTDPGPRRPIRWSTAWRMTRLGRPPVV